MKLAEKLLSLFKSDAHKNEAWPDPTIVLSLKPTPSWPQFTAVFCVRLKKDIVLDNHYGDKIEYPAGTFIDSTYTGVKAEKNGVQDPVLQTEKNMKKIFASLTAKDPK